VRVEVSGKEEGTNLDVDLVSAEDDRDVLTDSLEVSVPVGDVLVGDSRCDVEHYNRPNGTKKGSVSSSLSSPFSSPALRCLPAQVEKIVEERTY
jgi:hypothetical protein